MSNNRERNYRAYKMVDSRGRTKKYGISSNLKRRESENRAEGQGNRIVPMSGPRTRSGAKARETELIQKYQRRTGRKPAGNKIR